MKPFWEKLQPLGVTKFLDQAIDDGRIRYAGFSFHDEMELFKEIVDAYDWTFCQIQYNFMDEKYQAGTEGLEYASRKDIGVVVMEPLRGGMLSTEIPAIKQIWDRAPIRRCPSEWALRWVWNRPEVSMVLSGMSDCQQVVQNVSYAAKAQANTLTPEELSLFEEAKSEYLMGIKVPCTSCNYCMPCPSDVNIPECFSIYNSGCMYEAPDVAQLNYKISLDGMLTGEPSFASQCQECGECEAKCPQKLPIRDRLKDVAEYFGK
jgi:predicted aldo/keto reductase-like oxidoreductase